MQSFKVCSYAVGNSFHRRYASVMSTRSNTATVILFVILVISVESSEHYVS